MPAYTGSQFYLQFIYAITKGGTPAGTVTFQGKYRSFSFENPIDMVDVSAGADTEKSYITALADKTMSLTMLDPGGSDGSAIRRACARGNHGTLTWGGEGTATGKPKYSCPAFVENFSGEYVYDAESEFEVPFQGDGAWISNFEISGSTW